MFTAPTNHSHAVRLGIIDSNPAKGARRMASSRRTRRLSAIELGKLGAAMQLASTRDENPKGLAAVRLIALSGFRLSEVQQIERTWVNPDFTQRAEPLEILDALKSL